MRVDASILSELSSLGLTGEQHDKVLSILSRLLSAQECLREKARARTSRWRQRNVTVTLVSPQEKKSTPLPPVAKATAQSVNDLVWRECPQRLQDLGLSERAARSNLGRWLKQTKSPEKVLAAVEAAERAGTKDPVPYIVEALKPKVLQFGRDWEAGAARQIEARKKEKQITPEEREANLAKLTGIVNRSLKWNQ